MISLKLNGIILKVVSYVDPGKSGEQVPSNAELCYNNVGQTYFSLLESVLYTFVLKDKNWKLYGCFMTQHFS